MLSIMLFAFDDSFIFCRSPENKELNEKDLSKWKKAHDALLEILQQCAEYVHDEGLLNEEQLHKYHMSGMYMSSPSNRQY